LLKATRCSSERRHSRSPRAKNDMLQFQHQASRMHNHVRQDAVFQQEERLRSNTFHAKMKDVNRYHIKKNHVLQPTITNH